MPLTMRKAHPTDSALLHQLGFEIYSAHFAHLWISTSEMNHYLEQEYSHTALARSLRDSGERWYVLETDRPVGFAKITWSRPIPQTTLSGTLLNKLYLSLNETGKNYGKLIFERVITVAQEQGEDFLWLEVLSQNERARRFYENQGMRHIKDTFIQTASQQSTLHILGMRI